MVDDVASPGTAAKIETIITRLPTGLFPKLASFMDFSDATDIRAVSKLARVIAKAWDPRWSVENERAVLLSMFCSNNGWERLAGWSTGPVDGWDGITTSEVGLTKEIDLCFKNLEGGVAQVRGIARSLSVDAYYSQGHCRRCCRASHI